MDSEDRSTQKDTSSSAVTSSLSDLIARLEKATGPDRAIDGLIKALVNPPPSLGDEPATIFVRYDRNDDLGVFKTDRATQLSFKTLVPPYTSSIDAARALGGMCVFASDIGADGLPMVKIIASTTTSPIVEHTGIARTLELAWVIAALKARSHIESLPANDSAETRLEN